MAVAAGGASASMSVVHGPDLVSHSQEPVLTEPSCPYRPCVHSGSQEADGHRRLC